MESKTCCVLIVEDDKDIVEIIKELLEFSGFEVKCAYDGQEALDYLHSSNKPCLILLDLMMPVMDGLKFREHQLLDPSIAKIPVVIMSADINIAKKCRETGANEYLKKPIPIDDILAAVKRYCH